MPLNSHHKKQPQGPTVPRRQTQSSKNLDRHVKQPIPVNTHQDGAVQHGHNSKNFLQGGSMEAIPGSELQKEIEMLKAKIRDKDKKIETVRKEIDTEKSSIMGLKSKLKSIEKTMKKKDCSECFKYTISSNYGKISFNHILKIVHDEVELYVKYLEYQISCWRPKADMLIGEIKSIIYEAIPKAEVRIAIATPNLSI